MYSYVFFKDDVMQKPKEMRNLYLSLCSLEVDMSEDDLRQYIYILVLCLPYLLLQENIYYHADCLYIDTIR